MSALNGTAPNLHGFVLVGGASSRMGRDKAQMAIGGQKLFERSAAALRAAGLHRITLVGKVGSDFDSDLPVIDDIFIDAADDIRAPIVGVYTALSRAKTPWIGILACDLPFVTGDLMTRLAGICSDEFHAIVPIQPDARSQPLCGFYRCESCLPVVEGMIKSNDLKMQGFLSRLTTRFVEFNEIADLEGSANFFVNVNSSKDYAPAVTIEAG